MPARDRTSCRHRLVTEDDSRFNEGATLELLKRRILRDARHLGKGVLKVDSFLNHQIDFALMRAIGEEFARRFSHTTPTRILTVEASGIAPAFAASLCLQVDIVFARKHQPITMKAEPFKETSTSPTHGRQVELIVSSEYLLPGDRVLIIDDFLASAETIIALSKLIARSGASLVGIGAVIEKVYSGGRQKLEHLSVPIEALASIASVDGDRIILADCN